MLISASGDVEKFDNMEPKELNKIEYLKENQISTMKEKNTNLVVNHFLQSEKSCCNNELKKHITIAFIILFLLAFVGSVALFCFITFTNKFNESIVENLVLKNGSRTLEWWVEPPIEPLIKVHVFNYTNIDRYMKGQDDKIKLNDVGPYVYREIVQRVNLEFTEDHKITFQENRTQIFDKERSGNLREDDILIVPNVPFIAALSAVADEGFFSVARHGLNALISLTQPKEFQPLSVKSYMYGYTDAFMNGIATVKPDFDPTRVGMLAGRKGISIDNFTIFTGEDTLDNLGRVYAMNGETEVNNWSTENCNKIDGSDGSQFTPSMVDKTQILQIFIKSFCRSFPLVYESEVTILNGIPAWRYRAPKGVFESSRTNPENKCYCEETRSKNCPPDGVFDTSSCADGIPLYVSYPHFYEGEESLFEHFEGLSPSFENHSMFADIHPRLAFPIGGASRFQVNMKIRKGSSYNKMPTDIILPLVWIEITSGHIPDNLMSMIYHTTFSANASYLTLQYGSLIGSLVSLILLMSSTFIYFSKLTKKSGEPVNNRNIIVTLSVQPNGSQF